MIEARGLTKRYGSTVAVDALSFDVRPRGDDKLATLTPREREVLSLMAEGRSNAGIAHALVVSAGAVEKHVASIFAKLGMPPSEDDNRRVLAVLRYLRREPDD
jgi:DNA-binding NarL/FixJ family response regulator